MVSVRPAAEGDLAAIAEIYAHHVTVGVATFELDPPDGGEWRRRLSAVHAAGLPFLVATMADRVVGYAYCAPWKSRPAYRHTVEDSVYLAPDATGQGIGGRLLDGLLADCAAAGIRQVIAVISHASAGSDQGAAASVALHRGRGFREAGRLTAVGYKHGRWLDTLLLQRSV